MPKIPDSLKDNLVSSKLRDLMAGIVDKSVTTNPSILLHPQIPKPMHGMAPRNVLGRVWWEAERQAAYASTNYHCEACSVPKWEAKYHKWLEAHETYDIDYLRGRMTYLRSSPLCHFCHNYIHRGRLQWLFETQRINHQKFAAIIQHGDAILAKAKLKKPKPYVGPFAEWTSWRLIVHGKEYKGKFKDLNDWQAQNGFLTEE